MRPLDIASSSGPEFSEALPISAAVIRDGSDTAEDGEGGRRSSLVMLPGSASRPEGAERVGWTPKQVQVTSEVRSAEGSS